jgi:hypothetical protein
MFKCMAHYCPGIKEPMFHKNLKFPWLGPVLCLITVLYVLTLQVASCIEIYFQQLVWYGHIQISQWTESYFCRYAGLYNEWYQ